MTTDPNPAPEPTPTTFTQADVDRIVADRLKREKEATKAKYADYDELKAKAEKVESLTERATTAETTATAHETRALRAEVALAKGLTPTQAKRLVGSTTEELEADADELLNDIGAQLSNGNHVPREGDNPKPGDDPMRTFARSLFSRGESD